MKKLIVALVLLLLVVAGVYYYVALPAINLHSPGMWSFISFVVGYRCFCCY